MTTNELYTIADDIHKALTRPPIKNFKTIKEKRIEFMRHLSGQGFTNNEIGEIYGVTGRSIRATFKRDYNKKRKRL